MKKDKRTANETMKLMVAIGVNIRKRRTELNMTQEKLAEMADINEKFLSSIENNNEANISVGYLVAIALALDTSIGQLMKI